MARRELRAMYCALGMFHHEVLVMESRPSRRMQELFLGSFLVIFILTSVLTLLALFFDLGTLTSAERAALLSATLLEVAAGIVALFYSTFRLVRHRVSNEESGRTRYNKLVIPLGTCGVFLAGAIVAVGILQPSFTGMRGIAREVTRAHFMSMRGSLERVVYESYLPYLLHQAHASVDLDGALREALAGRGELSSEEIIQVYVEESVRRTSIFRADLLALVDAKEREVMKAIDEQSQPLSSLQRRLVELGSGVARAVEDQDQMEPETVLRRVGDVLDEGMKRKEDSSRSPG